MSTATLPRTGRLHILVVEDDADTRANLCDLLEMDDYQVATAESLTEGLGLAKDDQWDVVILDRKLPDGNAEDFLPRFKMQAGRATFVIITAYADLNGVMSALRHGVDDYLLKPFNPDLLRKTFERIAVLKEARQKALRAERLAAIGQMVTGLTHESRNALQRCQACLEMLEMEVGENPTALDLIRRAQRAQEQLNQLFDEVRGYAAPILLERTPCTLSTVWHEAWENLSAQREGRGATLRESGLLAHSEVRLDRFRMVQVFRNLLENSLSACKGEVEISIHCSRATLESGDAIQISFRDNGPGLSPEQKRRIFEPFYTTKTHGTGLGMAIAQRIVEAHGGTIRIGDGAAPGAEIVLVLPAA